MLPVTVRLSRPANGRFTAASLKASGFRALAGGACSFRDTAAQAQPALRRLVFDPTDNQVAPGRTVTASDGSLTSTDDTNSVVATPVNDRPAGVAASYRVTMNQALVVPAGRGVLAGASAPDSGRLRAVLVSRPAVGRLS